MPTTYCATLNISYSLIVKIHTALVVSLVFEQIGFSEDGFVCGAVSFPLIGDQEEEIDRESTAGVLGDSGLVEQTEALRADTANGNLVISQRFNRQHLWLPLTP